MRVTRGNLQTEALDYSYKDVRLMIMDFQPLRKLTTLIRYYILMMTTAAQSGHLTSSLSATDLLTVLFFKHFKFDFDYAQNPNNDRLIFSKGHASPLFYALYAAAGKITETELLSYRTFASNLEGHPTPRFNYTEAATGSLGQGLSVALGQALAIRKLFSDQKIKNKILPKIYTLLGDGEMAEGSVWEAIQTASYYKVNNLITIIDVNRLGQSKATMLEYDIDAYGNRIASFGWQVIKLLDGHDLELIDKALSLARESGHKPVMIIAKTIKGKGVSFLENKDGWHGRALSQEESQKALLELGTVDKNLNPSVTKPQNVLLKMETSNDQNKSGHAYRLTHYDRIKSVATRKAFGLGLVALGKLYADLIVLDGDVKNSTYTQIFEKSFPQRFYELFIAEQNMVGTAIGFSKRGFKPVVSTFACFLSRAADQIRMADISGANIIFNGSHAGVSIGQDGPSQMGLEDISLFRSLLNSIVLYPADAISTERLLEQIYQQVGISYIRTTRPETPLLYKETDQFAIGSSKVLRKSANDQITTVAAGITLFEALTASEELKQEGIAVRVIDCYSIKPIDVKTLKQAAVQTKALITVEDHYPVGGLGDAVLEALAENKTPVYKLTVSKIPRAGKPQELFDYEEISSRAIIKKVKQVLNLD